jgi:hypothetical protein
MFHQVIHQCAQALHQIEICLDKAEHHAKLKKYDAAILLTSRLAPDQDHFIRQVQFGADYIRYGAARLSGQTPPKWEDNETTIEEVRARIQKTVAYAQSIKKEQYEGAAERKVEVNWAPGRTIRGDDYFHVTTAYAILRHNGVDVGKADFLGFVALI